MSRVVFLLFVVFVLSIASSSSYAEDVTLEDDVHVLTTANFDNFVQGEDLTVVEFYAPWCGHCKKLAPEWSAAAKVLAKADPPVKLAKVDATVESDLGSRFGVTGYPTIKFFRRGVPSSYDGPRDSAGIVRYIKANSGPSSKPLENTEAVTAFTESNDGVAIVYFGSPDSTLFASFNQVANQHRNDFRFGHTHDPNAAKHFEVSPDTVVLFQAKKYQSKLEENKHVFQGLASQDNIETFIYSNVLPLAGEITQDNTAIYHKKGLPVVKLFVDIDWDRNLKGVTYQLNRLRKIAKDYRDKFSFAIASKKNYAKELADLGLEKIEEAFAIIKNDLKYRSDTPSTYSPEGLKQLLDDFLSSKISPFFKSEPIPTEDQGPVKVVVGKNFKDIVYDETKDVLIEMYAPWCGHCKTLAPIYEELAKKLKKYDSVVIAKIDATANDIPPEYSAKGYPTIYFAPSGKKSTPMKYEGAREVKDFIKFIKKNAHFPLKSSKDSETKEEL